MVHSISRIRRQVIALFCGAAVAAMLVLVFAVPIITHLTPEMVRSQRIIYVTGGVFLMCGMILALSLYLRPISDLAYALEIGSTPTLELVWSARQIAFNAPVYFFVLPTAVVLLLLLSSNALQALLNPYDSLADHLPVTLLIAAIVLGFSLLLALISRQWMRPVLLYTATRFQAGGYRLNVRSRLRAVVLSLTLIALLSNGLVVYDQVVEAYREQIARISMSQLENAVDLLSPDLSSGQALDRIDELLRPKVEYDSLLFLDDGGGLVDQRPAGSLDLVGEAILVGPLTWRSGHEFLAAYPGGVRWAKGYLVGLPTDQGWVGLSYQVQPFRSAVVVRSVIALMVAALFLLLIAAVVSHYLAADLVLDLRDVTSRLLDIAHEERVDLSSPVPLLSLDEVGDLILAYNALQQRVRMQQEQIEYKQRQLIALQSLAYKIGTTRDLDHLFAEVIRDVERFFGYHNVSILLVDEEHDELYFAASGYLDKSLRQRRFKIGSEGVVGRVAATGEPLLIGDVASCDFYIPDGTNTRSEMAVPLSVGDRIIGVFNVSSERTSALNDNDLRIVTALSNQVAIAIENARLFARVVQDANELEHRAQNLTILHDLSTALGASLKIEDMLQTATAKLVSLFKVDHSMAILFSAEDAEATIVVDQPSLGLAGRLIPVKEFVAAQWCLTRLALLYIPDTRYSSLVEPLRGELVALGIESILWVPLLTKGHVMGLFSLGSIGSRRSFQPDEIDVIQTVAAQVAVALENTQLIEDLHLQAQMLAHMASDVTAERRKLDAVLRNLADGLLVTDAAGHVELHNRAFLAMFGLEGQDPRGRLIATVIPEAPLQHLVTQTCQGRVTRIQEFSLLDGRAVQVAAAPVSELDEEPRVVMVLRDVTSERQLKQMKSDFISTVSHELRTPLTPVMGFAKLIRKSFDRHIVPLVPPEHKEGQHAVQRIDRNLGILIGEVERLSVLVEDVLFLADLDAGRLNWHMREVDLNEILKQEIGLLRPQAEAKGLEILSSLPEAMAWVYGDADRLMRMVQNLLSNALKFTERGQISVEAQIIRRVDGRWEPEPRVTVSEELGQSAWVLVTVSDTGPGIAGDTQRTLFERFGQGALDLLIDKPEGTGLGLAISKEIVQYHGGRIWVESKVGEGSTFAFLVPFSPFQEGHGLSTQEVSFPESAPVILVVDDEPGMRSLMHHILLGAGYHVRFAQDGPTALNMVRSNNPDLVLLDIMIPGISGLDVISVLKADERTKDIPIVVISAISAMDKATRLGADAYFSKPIDQDALLQTLGELLSSQLLC